MRRIAGFSGLVFVVGAFVVLTWGARHRVPNATYPVVVAHTGGVVHVCSPWTQHPEP